MTLNVAVKSGRLLVISALLLLLPFGCGRKSLGGRTIVSHETLYRQGLAAFHEGTPNGYARAIEAFRNASALRPRQCEYSLNMAQALFFLVSEKRNNWEEFRPNQVEAAALIGSVEGACASNHEAFLLRLHALALGRGPKRPRR
jgi:hypothetical protein